MSEAVQIIAGVFIGQIVMSVITVAMIKVDMSWLKRQMRDHENRLRKIEHQKCEVSEFSELGI